MREGCENGGLPFAPFAGGLVQVAVVEIFGHRLVSDSVGYG